MHDGGYDVIIIGAGHNGLVAAWYLAQAGQRVLVLERRHIVGGACVTEELWPGYRVPACAYVCYLLQSKIIRDLRLRELGFQLHHLEPGMITPFPSGRVVVSSHDEDRTVRDIAAVNRRDAEVYPRYRELRRKMAGLLQPFMLAPAPSLSGLVDLARQQGNEDVLDRLLFGSVGDLVEECFESPEIQGYAGGGWDAGDPDAPGSILASIYASLTQFIDDGDTGIVVGGMGGITQAMASAARESGVVIRNEAEVEEILVDDHRTAGVRLAGGEEVRSRIVVSNADPKRTFLSLVPRDALPDAFVARVSRLRTRAGYYKFHARLNGLPDFSRYLGADHDPRYLAHIRISPSLDYYRESWSAASHGQVPESIVMAVQIPTVYDRTLVDGGGHVMSIWAQYAPIQPAGLTNDEHGRRAGERMIDILSEYAPNTRDVIDDWLAFTPKDIERRMGMTDGNIRHLDIIAGQMFRDRPLSGYADYRTPVSGLYLCGAGTHPGGDVTGAPGHNAAREILFDLQANREG
jgi:phytoene dehydrogenase-like protein